MSASACPIFDEWIYDEERYAGPQRRRTKRQAAKRTKERCGLYSTAHARLRTLKPLTMSPNKHTTRQTQKGSECSSPKSKKPGRTKVKRLHRFHRAAFGAWLETETVDRDGWTKASRRLDGGALMKQQWLEEQQDDSKNGLEDVDPEDTREKPSKPVDRDINETNPRPSLASLEAVGILAKLWPASRIQQGMRVCSWIRKELAATAEHVAFQSMHTVEKEHERAWKLVSGQKSSEKSTPMSATSLLEISHFHSLSKLEVAFCFSPYYRNWQSVSMLQRATQHTETLVTLNMRGGHLGRLHLSQLPSMIKGLRLCKKLKRLDLSFNHLNGHCWSASHVRARLAPLASALSHLGGSLEELLLDSNSLDEVAMAVLAPALQQLSQLRALSLRESARGLVKRIGSGGATSLASALRQCPRLERLEVGEQRIKDEGLQAIGSALGTCSQLAYLGLQGNALSMAGAAWLVEALGGQRMAVDLSLSAASARPRESVRLDAAALLHRVQQAGAQWTSLSLRGAVCVDAAPHQAADGSGQGEGERADIEPHMPLGRVGRGSRPDSKHAGRRVCLEQLDLGRVKSKHDVLQRLAARASIDFGAVRTLSLCGTVVGEEGLRVLAGGLGGFRSALRELNMRGCLSPACCSTLLAEFLSVLGQAPLLETLQLAHNSLRGDAMLAMQQSVLAGGFTALRTLGLSCNKLGGERGVEGGGLAGVCGVLRGSEALSDLDLQANAISAAGIQDLTEALEGRRRAGRGAVRLNLRENCSNSWSPRRLLRLLGSAGGISALELSRGDYRVKSNGKAKYEGRGEAWRLACWLMGWPPWAYAESLAHVRMKELAALGLSVYTEK